VLLQQLDTIDADIEELKFEQIREDLLRVGLPTG
jgi:hypothetical protein